MDRVCAQCVQPIQAAPRRIYCSKRCCDNATRTQRQSRAFVPIKNDDELLAWLREAEPEAFAWMADFG
jgi:hypothetical protein